MRGETWLAIAVGTPLTWYPPAQSRTSARWRIRFFSQLSGGEASVRKGMEHSRLRKPVPGDFVPEVSWTVVTPAITSGRQFRDTRTCPSLFSLHEVFHFHGSRAMVLQLICFVTGRFHDMRSPTGCVPPVMKISSSRHAAVAEASVLPSSPSVPGDASRFQSSLLGYMRRFSNHSGTR